MVLRGDFVGNMWPPKVEKFSLSFCRACLCVPAGQTGSRGSVVYGWILQNDALSTARL